MILSPVDSAVGESIHAGHRSCCSNKPSSKNSTMSNTSNKTAMSSSTHTSAMANETSRYNTDSPHPVGANSMGSAGMVTYSSH